MAGAARVDADTPCRTAGAEPPPPPVSSFSSPGTGGTALADDTPVTGTAADSPPAAAAGCCRTWPLPSADPRAALRRAQGGAVAEALTTTCADVAAAILTLLAHCARPGPTSVVWSERYVPLCGAASPLVSFLWVPSTPKMPPPRAMLMEEYLRTLAARLELRAVDLVAAYVLLERVVFTRPSELRLTTTRPLVLACIVIVMKMSTDTRLSTSLVFECVEDVLDAVAVEDICAMEWRLMELLDWRVPVDRKVYELYERTLAEEAR